MRASTWALAVGLVLSAVAWRTAGAAAPADQYRLSPQEVFDRRTGLTWERNPDQKLRVRADAISYCATLDPRVAWRLPTVKELLTLVDPRAVVAPSIDTTAFPGTAIGRYWASTVPAAAGGGWSVDFDGGANLETSPINALINVRCVR